MFADDHHRKKLDELGDPLVEIESHIDFSALAAAVDTIAPRPVSPQGGRPPYPTETINWLRVFVFENTRAHSDASPRVISGGDMRGKATGTYGAW